jgi:hypothetical protein
LRLGHINLVALHQMAHEELVRGLPQIGEVAKVCDTCLGGKQKRTPFPRETQYRAE